MRTDCPTKYCTLKPKPVPPADKRTYLYPILAVLVALLCGALLYILKLSRDARRYDRLAESRRLFLGAAERFAEARRDNEEAHRMMRELAAAANLPMPQDYGLREDYEDSIQSDHDIEVSPPIPRQVNQGDTAHLTPESPRQPPPRIVRLSDGASDRLASMRRATERIGANMRNAYRPLNSRMRTRLHSLRRHSMFSGQFNRLDEEEET